MQIKEILKKKKFFKVLLESQECLKDERYY